MDRPAETARPPAPAWRATACAAPEMELLIQCARLELGPERQARVRALLRQGLDAERLSDLAVHHKMVPLLHWHLRELADGMEGCLPLESLRTLFARNARRMLQLTGELLEIVWLFEEHGIVSVPYKGPALGAQLYGNPALRQAGDLDLVVRREDVRRAHKLLVARGYRAWHALSSAAEAFMIRSRYSETFVGSGAVVELHWAFTNRDVAFPLDLEVLAPRLKRLPLGGHSVNVFSPEDLLLILCVHGAKHRWDCLEWTSGVAELLRSGNLECREVVGTASRLGVRRMLLLGLGLAHDLLGAPVPDDVVRHVRADPAALRSTAEVADRLLAGRPECAEEPGDRDLFRLQLRERRRDRVRFLLYRLTTPSNPERWAAVAIGRHYFPLHAVLRPWMLVGKLLTIVHRRFATPPRNSRSTSARSDRRIESRDSFTASVADSLAPIASAAILAAVMASVAIAQ